MAVDVSTARVMIVDDDDNNLHFMSRALQKAGFPEQLCVSDPFIAVDKYREFEPEVLLLDMRLPPVDGFYVLDRLRELGQPEELAPVIMVTGDASDEVKRRALESGVADFIYRQFDLTEVVLRTRNLLQTRRLYLQISRHKEWLEEMVRERTRELEEAQREILERLAIAAEYRDDQTAEHTRRVARMSARIAEELGQPHEFVRSIEAAALLHDLGKIGVPDALLWKPGPLASAEYEALKEHTTIGARVLDGCTDPVLQMAQAIALCHHEHWDGNGYPRNIFREQTPLAARIVAVADAYDAITSERPYKEPRSVEEAVREITSRSGSHFEPAVVSAFVRVIEREHGRSTTDRAIGARRA